ncbi:MULTISPECIES: DUF3072 domain-containing protein [unclassified Streptomyces]|uniref:DUF3072 domain-containing protein n=1 Tax=unclassified Streptomyces TaxID=2593676 RepID=UPI0006C60063|nr:MULTISPECIES: DUF3072 domain-containing protein [unclassified Streptomyces]KOU84334.1 hypothetical protein ADK93_25355 [Streptomyces sp. XY58]KOV09774.1 hypothetical protein ADK89_06765 [Streptomyces sp. XY37]KOV46661.1 hypothetical protein ADK99_21540 [Streptomyces sp. MMG1064]
MSGFARDPKYYGDRLVYEPLERKWAGYHARHCGCGLDWLEGHAVPAGFTVIPRGRTGYYGLVGPGLTEGVGEEALTTNALWEAVTGTPGTQTWHEPVHITCRSPESEAARRAENEKVYGPRRERAEKAKAEPATDAQVKYLTTLAEKVGKERFDAEFAKVIKGSDIAPRTPRQRCATAAKRLTKARARKLITALVGHD